MGVTCISTQLGIILALLLAIAKEIDSKDCYYCTYTDNGARLGQECVTDPTGYSLGQNTVPCQDGMHCFVQTKMDTSSGNIYTFERGCGLQEATCDENIHYKTCIYTCDSHLCNTKTDDVGKPLALLPSLEQGRNEVADHSQQVQNHNAEYTTCYSCTYSYHPLGDTTCVNDPAAVIGGTVQCLNGVTFGCAMFRQWDKDQGVVQTLSRGCQHTPPGVDQCGEYNRFINCYYFCDTDLCNDDVIMTDVMDLSHDVITGDVKGNNMMVDSTADLGMDVIAVRSLQQHEDEREAGSNASDADYIMCYSCTYSYHPEADTACLEDPENMDPIYGYPVQCNSSNTYGCSTFQQWDKGEDVMRSFSRGCQFTEPVPDYCDYYNDVHFISCYYFCDTDLCNDANMSTIPPPPETDGAVHVYFSTTLPFAVFLLITMVLG